LFRVSAGVKELESLKISVDKGEKVVWDKLDAHLVAGLLKCYFIELPQPLFTFGLYDNFIAAIDDADPKHKLKEIVAKLPINNRTIANCLFAFLNKVAARSEVNKMTSQNLAIVFSQILLRPKIETIELLRHAPKVAKVLKVIIENVHEIFPFSSEDESLFKKGLPTSIDLLIGVKPKKKKEDKQKEDKSKEDNVPPEEQKLKLLKDAVEDAIVLLLDKLDALSAELNSTASLEDTIEIAKRIRTVKRIIFAAQNEECK